MEQNAEQAMYGQLSDILVRFINGDVGLPRTVNSLMQYIDRKCENVASEKVTEEDRTRFHDLLWLSRTTGKPDMFSDEMRWFWDNGRMGNV